MLIPKLVDNSASSNVQPPIFWYVVCIHETQLLACWTPKTGVAVKSWFSWPKSATKMILITLLTKSTPPNEIICINDHSEVWISDFCHRIPATSHSVIGLESVKYFINISIKNYLFCTFIKYLLNQYFCKKNYLLCVFIMYFIVRKTAIELRTVDVGSAAATAWPNTLKIRR